MFAALFTLALVGTPPVVQVMPVSDCLAKMGLERSAEPEIASEVIAVCGDLKDPEFAPELASALGAEWIEVGSKRRLKRDSAARKRTIVRARTETAKRGFALLPNLDGESSDRVRESISLILKFVEKYRISRPSEFRPNFSLPADRLLNGALRSIGFEAIGHLEDRKPVVYALTPNASQRPLPKEFGSMLAIALADRQALAISFEQIRTQISGTGITDWIEDRFSRFGKDLHVAEALVAIVRSQDRVMASLGLFDDQGSLIDSGHTVISPSYEAVPLQAGDLASVSLDSIEASFFSAKPDSRFPQKLAAVEPLSIVIPRALNEYSKRRAKPLVALLDDRLLPLAESYVHGQTFAAGRFLSAAAAAGLLEFNEGPKWIIAKPAAAQPPEERRVDRALLGKLLALHPIDVPAMADFAVKTGLSSQSSGLLRIIFKVIERHGAALPLPTYEEPEQALAAVGDLIRMVDLKSGTSRRWMAAGIPDKCKRMIKLWALSGLTTMEGNVPDLLRNGTEAIPNNLPADAVVEIALSEEPVLSKPDASTVFLQYPHTAAEIRAFLQSAPEMVQNAEAYYADEILFGSIRVWKLSIHLSTGQTLKAVFSDPPSELKKTTFGQLPNEFKENLKVR
ncbi:MAG: hypothetical protein H0W86_02410 [Armatimonadetes bacterium]|nr:hypothetical protein [Armatimonadota bacterium]